MQSVIDENPVPYGHIFSLCLMFEGTTSKLREKSKFDTNLKK